MAETQAKKKMGRPKKDNPLTNAQRQQRWRDKRKAQVAELLKIYFGDSNEKQKTKSVNRVNAQARS